jgi:hypothetical protein
VIERLTLCAPRQVVGVMSLLRLLRIFRALVMLYTIGKGSSRVVARKKRKGLLRFFRAVV